MTTGKRLRPKRARAADDVCWTVVMMMALGGLEIPMEWRAMLAEPMQAWSDEAVKDGDMPRDPALTIRDGS